MSIGVGSWISRLSDFDHPGTVRCVAKRTTEAECADIPFDQVGRIGLLASPDH